VDKTVGFLENHHSSLSVQIVVTSHRDIQGTPFICGLQKSQDALLVAFTDSVQYWTASLMSVIFTTAEVKSHLTNAI